MAHLHGNINDNNNNNNNKSFTHLKYPAPSRSAKAKYLKMASAAVMSHSTTYNQESIAVSGFIVNYCITKIDSKAVYPFICSSSGGRAVNPATWWVCPIWYS